MSSQQVRLLITDLDDTIYDWLGFYIPSFLAMVDEVHRITGLNIEEIKRSFQRVHRAHRTTEYAFSIQDLDVLEQIDAGLTLAEKLTKYRPAITAFRATRKDKLKPYPGVRETMERLVKLGVPIVAHTDSMMGYVSRRLRQLKLDRYFSAICAPRDHGLPEKTPAFLVRQVPDSEVLSQTQHLEFPPGCRKPDPHTLQPIFAKFDVPRDQVVYVGDSIWRDIALAKRAGLIDVWARYGQQHVRENYDELLKVTYWTEDDLAFDQRIRNEARELSPSFTIDSFQEIISTFNL